MIQFIELTGASSGAPIAVGTSHIIDIYPVSAELRALNVGVMEAETKTILVLPQATLEVRETFYEVINKLKRVWRFHD